MCRVSFSLIEIVHARPAKALVAEDEAARLDDVHRNAKAGAQPDQAGGVLGDVGLVKRKPHSRSLDMK